jgi:hypothetical protein
LLLKTFFFLRLEDEEDELQRGTLNKIEEETDWEREEEEEGGEGELPEEEEGEQEEESEEEEMRTGGVKGYATDHFPFPVLAPPEEFQNCLSPSAMYEVSLSTYQQQGTSSPRDVVVRHRSTSTAMTSSSSSACFLTSPSKPPPPFYSPGEPMRSGQLTCGNNGGSGLVRSTVSSPAYSQDSGILFIF